jgi:hypothetical protein
VRASRGTVVASGLTAARLDAARSLTFKARFTPRRGTGYLVTVRADDETGQADTRAVFVSAV